MERGVLKLVGTEIKHSFLKDDGGNWMQSYYTIVPE